MTDTCGAKTRSGTPCQLPAGWSTDHVGRGKCKMHGGAAGTGRPPTHGRYSTVRREALRAKIEKFRNDPEAGNLLEELAVLRALLEDYLTRFDDTTKPTGADIALIAGLIDDIGRLVERIAKILAMTALTQVELQLLQVTLIDAIKEFIPEPERQRAFVSRIGATLGGRVGGNRSSISALESDIDITGDVA